ncbi:hypothetical protein [Thiohalorhabdus methylotrophus]|uniref:AhpC/TSA family protein n=1 Tax=Thiohalorhabdus methylotrophus TaxID=3242694 RepID=A0ABV4TXT4_9GAMM
MPLPATILCGTLLRRVWRFVALFALPLLAGVASSEPQTSRAPEFPDRLPWLNVEHPLTLQDLRGKVVLLDFWAYGCINCLYVLADIERLKAEYGDKP